MRLANRGDIRGLVGACQDRTKLFSLRTFLRGLKVMLVPRASGLGSSPPRGDSYRIIQIKDIQLNAGNQSFDGPHGTTTVKVCEYNHDIETNTEFKVRARNIGKRHTTVLFSTLTCSASLTVGVQYFHRRSAGLCRDSGFRASYPPKT